MYYQGYKNKRGRLMINILRISLLFLLGFTNVSFAQSDACMEVSLTGTLGGPITYKDLAGAGTLVKIGTDANDCSDIHLQFDTGRATSMRLSQLGVNLTELDAVFISHLHSDHTVGFVDMMQTRWHSVGAPLDLVCAADVAIDSDHGSRTMSCENFGKNISSAAQAAGEIAQRAAESPRRNQQGPQALVNFIPVDTPLPNTPKVVWESGNVTVSAIASKHIAGHLSYRVDSPAGSVVIGGDAGNEKSAPPRESSTSAGVELISKDADVLVHSTIHPAFGPDNKSTFPAPIFYRQSTSTDLGALAKRANVKHLMLTHLIPILGADKHAGHIVPGGALDEADYIESTRESGYQGKVYVGKDLMTIRLPQ